MQDRNSLLEQDMAAMQGDAEVLSDRFGGVQIEIKTCSC